MQHHDTALRQDVVSNAKYCITMLITILTNVLHNIQISNRMHHYNVELLTRSNVSAHVLLNLLNKWEREITFTLAKNEIYYACIVYVHICTCFTIALSTGRYSWYIYSEKQLKDIKNIFTL